LAIVWRDKLLAFGVHFIATALLAVAASALIFGLWFPEPFNRMLGGTKLFELVVGCDLALGPLVSLVIFNRGKSRRALVTDYTVVAIVQLAAMGYGVWVMAASRPVYVVFAKDRFEVVMAQTITDKSLAEARDPRYARRPLLGPEFVNLRVPASEKLDVMLQEVAGSETAARPRFYAPYESGLEEIRKRAGTLTDLEKRNPGAKPAVAAAMADAGVPVERLRWLPVATRRGFWTALIDVDTGRPVSYANVDPYGGL
jgi:hypothetical protein